MRSYLFDQIEPMTKFLRQVKENIYELPSTLKSIKNSTKLKSIYLESMRINCIEYFIPIMGVAYIKDSILHYTFDDLFGSETTNKICNYLHTTLYLSLFLSMYIRKSILNSICQLRMGEINQEMISYNNDQMKCIDCEDSIIESLLVNIPLSTLYIILSLLLIIVNPDLLFISIPLMILQILLDGTSLTNYRLAHQGVCSKHRIISIVHNKSLMLSHGVVPKIIGELSYFTLKCLVNPIAARYIQEILETFTFQLLIHQICKKDNIHVFIPIADRNEIVLFMNRSCFGFANYSANEINRIVKKYIYIDAFLDEIHDGINEFLSTPKIHYMLLFLLTNDLRHPKIFITNKIVRDYYWPKIYNLIDNSLNQIEYFKKSYHYQIMKAANSIIPRNIKYQYIIIPSSWIIGKYNKRPEHLIKLVLNIASSKKFIREMERVHRKIRRVRPLSPHQGDGHIHDEYVMVSNLEQKVNPQNAIIDGIGDDEAITSENLLESIDMNFFTSPRPKTLQIKPSKPHTEKSKKNKKQNPTTQNLSVAHNNYF